MPESQTYDYCIVGAGPSGLTLAYKLLKGGGNVVVIERDNRVGGLAKSYNYDGQIFDTGPKRFHTDDKIVVDFINHIMEMIRIKRSTKVYFMDRYFEWPLNSTDLIKMPFNISLKCFFDLLKNREDGNLKTFRDYITSKYGETLYDLFFKPYTKKFLRWDPDDIHADWATTGINRTVIDKRLEKQTNSLFDVIRSLMLPEKIDTEFLYPKEEGFGGFYEKLLELCQGFDGFHIMYNDSISNLENNKQKFSGLTKSGETIYFDQLIWSGNLNDLLEIISPSNQKVSYLNTIFYNIICKEGGIGKNRAQWIYVSKGESLISRVTCMKEFAPYTCNDGYYNMVCELTDSQKKPVFFANPEKYTQRILEELVSMSLLKRIKFVEDIKINPILDTYPIYHKNYIKDFATTAATIKGFSKNIHLLGRCGAFWYNNSDHSIRFAIDLAEKLLGNSNEEFDYRKYFGGISS